MILARKHLLVLLVLALAGCDMSEGPILVPDGGTDSGPEPDGGQDVEAPRVVATTPLDGAVDVAPEAAISIRFSEPMAPNAGTVSITANGAALEATRSFDEAGTELTLTAALPSSARVRVLIERDFTDLAGNALLAPDVLEFTTGDAVAPFVTGAEPAEGATDVSARIERIRIHFSEPLDGSRGTLTLEGGPGTLGEPAWTLGGLVVPVSGLAYGTAYRVVLSGFADPAGNALDGESYLGDGALDFTTGPDRDAPRVIDASPSEGQIEVPDTTATITVLFDEPMDTSIAEATLVVGGESTIVSGTWSEGGTRLELDVAGRLARNSAHALVVDGLSDAAGNALDPVPFLADGALDFVTGVDIFAPYVGFTDPVEGSSDASFRRSILTVVFSEAMDTSTTSVEVVDTSHGTSSFTATGTWSLAGTRLQLDVTNRLWSTRSYAIDFSAFRDAGGTALDTAHPYLGDGVLELTVGAPTGENCRDALTLAEATSTGGVHEWVLAPGVATINDGSNTCFGGNTPGVDAVIHYRKTTPSSGSGGTVLHVYVESGPVAFTSWMSVAVLRDTCEPSVAGLGPARIRCVDDRDPQHLYLDVGAGDYYVWFSRYTGSDFPGATVRIEEIALPPEGEACPFPFSTSTAAPIYEAPASATEPHVWRLPPDAMHAMDHAIAYGSPGAMECDPSSAAAGVGVDAVIELPKASATSVGWLLVEPISSTTVVVELRERCDGTDGMHGPLACNDIRTLAGSNPPRILETTFGGAAGSRFVWVANDNSSSEFTGATVSYLEVEPAAGDTCATAIPLTVGTTNPVTPNRPYRLGAPSCFARTDSVTWYRFTAPERFVHVHADGASAIAAVRVTDADEMSCQPSAASSPLVTFVPAGTEVCVAVASSDAVTSLSLEAFPYSGNLGVPTQLNIERPLNASGTPRTITAQNWLAVTPTTLYQGIGSQGVLVAPIGGNAVADFRDDFTSLLGNGAVAIGEALFSIDDTTSSTAARVYRLVTSDGAWSPTPWDTGSAYPSTRSDAITFDGAALLYPTRWSSTQPTRFYSLSPTTPGPATLLGSTSLLREVSGIAADANYLYLTSRTDGTVATEGVYRLPRADLGAAPELLALVDINITRASIVLDDLEAPTYLYFRADDGTVHVIADPAGAAPRHLGIISAIGNANNETMAIHRATGALYIFETTTVSSGNFVRLD